MNYNDPLDLFCRALCEKFVHQTLEISPPCFHPGCLDTCKVSRFSCTEKIFHRNQLYFVSEEIRWMFVYGDYLKVYDLLKRIYSNYDSLHDFKTSRRGKNRDLLLEHDRLISTNRNSCEDEREYEIVAYDENDKEIGTFGDKKKLARGLGLSIQNVIDIYNSMLADPKNKLKYSFKTRKKK